jgi:uncharacterized RDD family membrane protein YckC
MTNQIFTTESQEINTEASEITNLNTDTNINLNVDLNKNPKLNFDYNPLHRILAGTIDKLIPTVVSFLLFLFLLTKDEYQGNFSSFFIGIIIIAGVSNILLFTLLKVLTVSVFGQTLGQKLFNLKYITKQGQKIGFLRLTVRSFLTTIIPYSEPISAILVLFTKEKKSVGDFICQTNVIQTSKPKNVIYKSLIIVPLLIAPILIIDQSFDFLTNKIFGQYTKSSQEQKDHQNTEHYRDDNLGIIVRNPYKTVYFGVGGKNSADVVLTKELSEDAIKKISKEIVLKVPQYDYYHFTTEGKADEQRKNNWVQNKEFNNYIGTLSKDGNKLKFTQFISLNVDEGPKFKDFKLD